MASQKKLRVPKTKAYRLVIGSNILGPQASLNLGNTWHNPEAHIWYGGVFFCLVCFLLFLFGLGVFVCVSVCLFGWRGCSVKEFVKDLFSSKNFNYRCLTSTMRLVLYTLVSHSQTLLNQRAGRTAVYFFSFRGCYL